MNIKKLNWPPRTACADSSGNIYIGGDFVKIDNVPYWGIAKWNGFKWDSLSSAMNVSTQCFGGNYGARTLSFYKNHIYMGGGFKCVQGKPISYIARWDGANWDSLPQSPNAFVDKLVVLQGKLYAIGSFNKIGAMNCNRLAVWDGTSWSPIFVPFSVYDLADVTEYNGELYIGGNISNGTLPAGLIKFDGTSWSVVGQGILGNAAWVNALKVFNNELYIGGWIEKGAGNAGDFLIKWDGTSYKEVIKGLNGQVSNLTVVPDGLIATGCFSTPYSYVLKISNSGICGYHDVFNNCSDGAVYANNKLYFYGSFSRVNGDSAMGYINNFNYTTQTDTCIDFVNGLKEHYLSNNVKIYPNPTNSILNILDEQNELQNATIEITNTLGVIILSTVFMNRIDISSFPIGMYYITIINSYNKRTFKILKE